MNYCSHCGSDALLLKIPEGDNRLRACCESCGMIHYQNPKMIVGCLPIFEEQILLCRRAIPPRHGYWNLPAGFLENGETLEEGAQREAKEEAGIEGEVIHLQSIYNVPKINQIYFFFLLKVNSKAFDIGIETLEAEWFEPEAIPFVDIAFPSSTFAIKTYLNQPSPFVYKVHTGTWRMKGSD